MMAFEIGYFQHSHKKETFLQLFTRTDYIAHIVTWLKSCPLAKDSANYQPFKYQCYTCRNKWCKRHAENAGHKKAISVTQGLGLATFIPSRMR